MQAGGSNILSSAAAFLTDFVPPLIYGLCQVCGAEATGIHYAASTCEGCKGFFKRSLPVYRTYKCFFGGSCHIIPETRGRCKACRFQKCVQAGMCPEGNRSRARGGRGGTAVVRSGGNDSSVSATITTSTRVAAAPPSSTTSSSQQQQYAGHQQHANNTSIAFSVDGHHVQLIDSGNVFRHNYNNSSNNDGTPMTSGVRHQPLNSSFGQHQNSAVSISTSLAPSTLSTGNVAAGVGIHSLYNYPRSHATQLPGGSSAAAVSTTYEQQRSNNLLTNDILGYANRPVIVTTTTTASQNGAPPSRSMQLSSSSMLLHPSAAQTHDEYSNSTRFATSALKHEADADDVVEQLQPSSGSPLPVATEPDRTALCNKIDQLVDSYDSVVCTSIVGHLYTEWANQWMPNLLTARYNKQYLHDTLLYQPVVDINHYMTAFMKAVTDYDEQMEQYALAIPGMRALDEHVSFACRSHSFMGTFCITFCEVISQDESFYAFKCQDGDHTHWLTQTNYWLNILSPPGGLRALWRMAEYFRALQLNDAVRALLVAAIIVRPRGTDDDELPMFVRNALPVTFFPHFNVRAADDWAPTEQIFSFLMNVIATHITRLYPATHERILRNVHHLFQVLAVKMDVLDELMLQSIPFGFHADGMFDWQRLYIFNTSQDVIPVEVRQWLLEGWDLID